MKLINKKTISMLFAIMFMVGCQSDFLDRPSQSDISTENFYQTKEEIRLATAALYGGVSWWEWNTTPYILIGDILSGNLVKNYYPAAEQLNTFTLSGSNDILGSAWKGLYIVVAHCNMTIKAIEENAPETVSDADKNAAIGEAKFIRAMAYYHLAMLFGDVPIIEDNTLLVKSPLVNRNIVADVYQFVVNDLTFAAENLPTSDEPGRVTTWSAQGLLAKVYLTKAGLGQNGGVRNQDDLNNAKLYAGNVCKNSGISLFPSYYDLFLTQNNDNPESLFALQWSATDGWGLGNQLLTYSPSNDINPQNNGAWSALSVSYDLYQLYTEQDFIRRKATFMLTGDHYPELNRAGGGYDATGTVMKKHIIGNGDDNNVPAMTYLGSIEHNALLRLADVYLVYAESILGNNASTSDAEALMYFNMVRERAGVDPVSVLDADTIFNERRIELACEGHYWYDLVRLSYYNPQKAISILNNQERVQFTYDDATGVATPNDPIGTISPATQATFTLQLPSSEVTANPKLADPAVPYYQ